MSYCTCGVSRGDTLTGIHAEWCPAHPEHVRADAAAEQAEAAQTALGLHQRQARALERIADVLEAWWFQNERRP